MTRGYAPKTIPAPLLIAVGLAFFVLLMYLILFLVSKKTRPYENGEAVFTEGLLPYYGVPSATQPAPQASRQWGQTSVRKEKEFRQDAYEALQRQEFDTEKEIEKIEQNKDFRKIQRLVY